MNHPREHRFQAGGKKYCFRIQVVKNKSGSTSYKASGTINKKQVRKNHKTEHEARKWCQDREDELLLKHLHGGSRQRVVTQLTPEQVTEAEFAYSRLAGLSMIDAVNYYLKRNPSSQSSPGVRHALDLFLDAKEAQGCRPLTMANLRTRVGRFVDGNPDRRVCDVTPQELRTYIERPGNTNVSRNNTRRALRNFFRWCQQRQNFTVEDPTTKLDTYREEPAEPEILTLEQARALMSATEVTGLLIPYTAIGIFAGVRPAELQRLTWENIDLKEKFIHVGAKASRTSERRLVDISDNLLDWLLPVEAMGTPIFPKNWRTQFKRLRESAGIETWPADVLRHTFCSCHLAHHRNIGDTAEMAGNSPVIIKRHYRELVKPKDAAEFWEIRPGGREVVDFDTKAKIG